MEQIAGDRKGRTLEIATRATRPQFPRKETSPKGNRHTREYKTHVTDNVGGNRHGRNIRGTRGNHTKRSDTFTDERRAHVVLRETLHHPLQPALA